MRNPRLSWILLHESLRIVDKDGNEEGKICALRDMFSNILFLLPVIQKYPNHLINIFKNLRDETILPRFTSERLFILELLEQKVAQTQQ